MSDSTVIGMVGSSSLTTTHHDGVSILIKVNDIKNHMVALSTERCEFRSHHTLYELKGILCDWVFCSKRFRTWRHAFGYQNFVSPFWRFSLWIFLHLGPYCIATNSDRRQLTMPREQMVKTWPSTSLHCRYFCHQIWFGMSIFISGPQSIRTSRLCSRYSMKFGNASRNPDFAELISSRQVFCHTTVSITSPALRNYASKHDPYCIVPAALGSLD